MFYVDKYCGRGAANPDPIKWLVRSWAMHHDHGAFLGEMALPFSILAILFPLAKGQNFSAN